MRQYLQEFFEEFDYPREACEALLQAYDAIAEDSRFAARFSALLARYDEDRNVDLAQLLAQMGALSEEAGVHAYTGKLMLSACLSRRLREYYRAEGFDEEMWFLTMCDLKWKLQECRLVHGVWGCFVSEWFNRFFNVSRFGIGRLQFELVPLGREYEKNGVKLPADMQVVNVHIPRTGGPLDPAQVAWSYEKAAAFFRSRFGLERVVFVCHSWLLFPRNVEALSEKSNIRRFMQDFEIVDQGEYGDYGEVWRLFDRKYEGDVDALPQDSSFRRAYAGWIRSGVKTGWGFGVYVYPA